MRKLLLSTILAGTTAVAAVAQTQDPATGAAQDGVFHNQAMGLEIRASDFIGMDVYSAEGQTDTTAMAGMQDNWDNIGTIEDVVLNENGEVEAVLVDVGGFLGIGARTVALDMDSVQFVPDDAAATDGTAADVNDYFLVVNATRAELEAAPEYAAGTMQTGTGAGTMGTAAVDGTLDQQPQTDQMAADPAADPTLQQDDQLAADPTMQQDPTLQQDDQLAADPAADPTLQQDDQIAADPTMQQDPTLQQGDQLATDPTLQQQDQTAGGAGTTVIPGTTQDQGLMEGQTADTGMATQDRTPIQREGWSTAEAGVLTTDTLTGARVYDANDDWVGSISELVMTTDGQISDAVVDVGGFLGIGAKPVALPLEQIDILQAADGNEIRVYVSQTREQLDAMPEFQNN
jgi:sporulation protein YlmC with PRC-barrel domain